MTTSAFIPNFFKLYNMLWKLILPLLKTHPRLKPGFRKRLDPAHLKPADLWIQAASAGEAYLAVQLVKALVPQHKLSVLVTCITQQGMDILTAHLQDAPLHSNIDLQIDWFFFDMPDVMSKAAAHLNPAVMVLLETEIWPSLIWFLKHRSTRVIIVNARLSAKSFRYYLCTAFLWKHLAPDVILATSDRYAMRYAQLFQTAVIQTMDNIKFESMETDDTGAQLHQKLAAFLPENLPITLLASIRKQEEHQVCDILTRILHKKPDQVVAVFPRHMHRVTAWKALLSDRKINWCLRSEIRRPVRASQVILWDRFGELKTAYGFARVVFVGGSLEKLGGQNFIEPAMAGAITITGPYYDDFSWVGTSLFSLGCVLKTQNAGQVEQAVLTALDPHTRFNRQENQRRIKAYVHSLKGGTDQACNEILKSFYR